MKQYNIYVLELQQTSNRENDLCPVPMVRGIRSYANMYQSLLSSIVWNISCMTILQNTENLAANGLRALLLSPL